MNKTLSILSLIVFSNCASQKVNTIIPSKELNFLSLVKQNNCSKEIMLFDNQEDFNNFQYSLVKTHVRSAPIFMVDFSTKNIAAICKSDIGSYEINSIITNNKNNILKLDKIEGYDNYGTEMNTLILEIPKTINTLALAK